MIVDAHVYSLPPRLSDPHVILPSSEKHVIKAIYTHPESAYALKLSSPTEIKASMEKSGIDRSMLVAIPWRDPSLCRETNDHVLTQAAEDDSFFALCAVQPKDKYCIQEAERCFAASALGLKVNPNWQGFTLDSPQMDDVAVVVAKNEKVLMIHADHAFKTSPASPACIFHFAKKHPDTSIIAAHMGGGLGIYNLNRDISSAMQNIWFDTAVSATLKMVDMYVQAGLGHKMIFGSDFPFNHSHEQKQVVEGIKKLRLEPVFEAGIFEKNFNALMGIKYNHKKL